MSALQVPEDIRELIALLQNRGELNRVAVEVDPDQEIAAITDRVCKQPEGKALLFEQVKGHPWPVATNLFGSCTRMAWALGLENLDQLGQRLASDLAQFPDAEAWDAFEKVVARAGHQPVRSQDGPCREEVWQGAAGLLKIPAIKSWPEDAGRYLTLPLVFTSDPETGETNCGMYRAQILDGDRLAVNFGEASGGGQHLRKWQRLKRPMPVAIALGGDAATVFSAMLPLPEAMEELTFAGYLHGRPVETVPCLQSELEVPARSEIVIEGVVEPGATAIEGPFGNHTGSYTEPKTCPLVRVTVITHRRGPIYPCTVVGPPPMEDCYMAKGMERLLLPVWQRQFSEIVDINFPLEGIFHGCALISVRGIAGSDGKELIRRMWQSRSFSRSKLLVALDEGVNVQDPSEVFWRVINNVDPECDVMVEDQRVGVDATCYTKAVSERRLRRDQAVEKAVARRWEEYRLE